MLFYIVHNRLAILYGHAIRPLTQNLEGRLCATEIRTLRYIQDTSLKEHRRNEVIIQLAGVEAISVLIRNRRLQGSRGMAMCVAEKKRKT